MAGEAGRDVARTIALNEPWSSRLPGADLGERYHRSGGRIVTPLTPLMKKDVSV